MNNKVEIVDLGLEKPNDGFRKVGEFSHEFPPTKMMWMPSNGEENENSKDILATTAECLRIWERSEENNAGGSFKEHKISRNVSDKFNRNLDQLRVLCTHNQL